MNEIIIKSNHYIPFKRFKSIISKKDDFYIKSYVRIKVPIYNNKII